MSGAHDPRPPQPANPQGRAAEGRPAPGRNAQGKAPQGRAGAVPQRVAVTGPRRQRAGGYSARPGAADLHAQPRLGQIYVRSLVRDQLRLSLGVLAVLAVVIGGLPAAFALVPALRTAELGGIRLAWLLLGVVAYPVLVGTAWFHVRHAERGERDFAELLSAGPRSPHGPPSSDQPPAPEPPARKPEGPAAGTAAPADPEHDPGGGAPGRRGPRPGAPGARDR